MARRKTRVKDKWREKRWVKIIAPTSFGNMELRSIPITDDENAIGRVVEFTQHDLMSGDTSQHNYKIYFQISEIKDDKAHTIFKRYEYSKEFLRSLIRRGSSKINFVIDVKTKDEHMFRLKLIILTHRRLNTSRKHALRLIAKDVIEKTIPEETIDSFVQSACQSKINADVMSAAKKLVKIRHVGLEKVKLVKTAGEQVKLLQAA